MSQKYLCPMCGGILPDDESPHCESCGWKPGDILSDDEIRDAVFQWLEEEVELGNNINGLNNENIAEELGISVTKILQLKSEFNKYYKGKFIKKEDDEVKAEELKEILREMRGGSSNDSINIPEWVLEPYKMQIQSLKEEKSRLERRNDELDKELRQEIRKPATGKKDTSEIEKLIMERAKDSILNPKTDANRPWYQDAVEGMLQSGQLGAIAGEVAALFNDLRKQNNPPPPQQQYNPYNNVPPANIKRGQRPPTPPPVQSEPQDVEFTEEVELNAVDVLIENYPDLPEDAIRIADDALTKEEFGGDTEQRVVAIIEILKAVAKIPDISSGMQSVMDGKYNKETAAEFLIRAYPEESQLIVNVEVEPLLKKAKYYIDHPDVGEHIKYLLQDDVKAKMIEIVEEISKRLEAQDD